MHIMTKYFGKLAYLGAGRYGTITRYDYSETASGKKNSWEIRPIGAKNRESIVVTEAPLILTSVRFARIDKTIFCAAVVHGETRHGYAICAPGDKNDNSFGRMLALARAINKDDAEDLLNDDFFNDYVEEYGASDDSKEAVADGADEAVADGADEAVADGADEAVADGADETVADGADEKSTKDKGGEGDVKPTDAAA